MLERDSGRRKFTLSIFSKRYVFTTTDWGKSWLCKDREEPGVIPGVRPMSWLAMQDKLKEKEEELWITLRSDDGKVYANGYINSSDLTDASIDEAIDKILSILVFYAGKKSDLPLRLRKRELEISICLWEGKITTKDAGETWVWETFASAKGWITLKEVEWEEVLKILLNLPNWTTVEVREGTGRLITKKDVVLERITSKSASEVIDLLLEKCEGGG